jgi:hypothetical protein
MTTLFATGIASHENSFEAGKQAASQAKQTLQEAVPHLIILFCSPEYDYQEVMKGIHSEIDSTIPIVGCTSAGQFTEQKVIKHGVACALISSTTHLFFSNIGTHLTSHPMAAIQAAAQNFPQDVDGYPYQSAILFVDGLAGKGEEAVMAASSILGPLVKFAGGAAADNFTFTQTAIFGNHQALHDAVSLCLITSRSPVVIATKHVHHPISPPLLITKTQGNVLYEVEGRPALDVWKDYLRDLLKARGIDVDRLELNELSKIFLQYEAGLLTGDNYKIRFPVSCNADGSLNFVCSIMQGSVVCIMDSTKEDQIHVVKQAAEIALKMTRGRPLAGAIIFDCACRAMILKEEFSKSIQASQEVLGPIPIIGCETYGEVAMEMGQLSGFHNTSTVIMLFPS